MTGYQFLMFLFSFTSLFLAYRCHFWRTAYEEQIARASIEAVPVWSE